MPDRRLMERHAAAVGRLLAERDFASIDEANAYLQDLLAGGGLPDAAPAPPLERAQEVVYRALEATGRRREQLARRALALSPDCADAYVLLAEATRDPHEARRLYEEGVQAGERALGPAVFARDAGHFWGLRETRPYMRARRGLAEALWLLGERAAALDHLHARLRLHPNDNQGVRYTLATWLLTTGADAALARLLAAYPDEASAHWAYTRTLALFRRHGAGAKAQRALRRALAVNPFVPLYLLGARKVPRRLPELVGLGDEDEAVAYVAEAVDTWLETPNALEWFVTAFTRELRAAPAARAPRPHRR